MSSCCGGASRAEPRAEASAGTVRLPVAVIGGGPVGLAAAALARPGEVPQVVARDAVRAAEQVARPVPGMPAAIIEETERVAAWLERPGVRLIEVEGEWWWPVHGSIDLGDLPRHALGDGAGG